VDVTADCQEIVKCVQQICGKIGSRWSNNFTLLHVVDIFKGSDIKKIKEYGKMRFFKLITIFLRLVLYAFVLSVLPSGS
jgi:hypothetical protein